MKRFCKGASNLKPQKPRYNPSVVIDYISKNYVNTDISLTKLTKKLITLLALITGQRVEALSKIKVKNIFYEADIVKIHINDHLKTSGLNKLQPVLKIPLFQEMKEEVCAFTALKIYLEKTSPSLRKDDQDYLFISFEKPYNTVTT